MIHVMRLDDGNVDVDGCVGESCEGVVNMDGCACGHANQESVQELEMFWL